jgi:hypothetical protein
MKKIIASILFLASFITSISLSGCTVPTGSDSITTSTPTTTNTTGSGSTTTSTSPFEKVQEGVWLSEEELNAIVSSIPTDKYEDYPYLHGAPLTATLYKNNEEIHLDINDPRVVGFMNLFNSSLYNTKYSHLQGLFPIDLLTPILEDDFRLVLTFTPQFNDKIPYATDIQVYSTFIITNKDLAIINFDLPGYTGDIEVEVRYPYLAFGIYPLHDKYPWLDIFGF